MIEDQCSVMACERTASVDDDGKMLVMIQRRENGSFPTHDNGIHLLLCEEHALHFLRDWAGLLAVSDAASKHIYVLVGLTLEEHRAVLARGLRTTIEWIGESNE